MKSFTQNPSRRLFLQQTAKFSALGAAAPLAMNLAALGSASAQTAAGGDYKALVCVFLSGGNDAYNTVLATDPNSWASYNAVRNQAGGAIALNPEQLLALSPATALASGRSLALHPELDGLQRLFNNQRRLAIVSNVGPLLEPMTKDEYLRQAKRAPSRLFSHNDQQSTWQAMAPEGASKGWGARLAEMIASNNNNNLFTSISVAGNAVWASGQTVKQYQLSPGQVPRFGTYRFADGTDRIFGSAAAGEALQRISSMQRTGQHPFQGDLRDVAKRSIDAERILSSALPSDNVAPFGPSSQLVYRRPDGTAELNPLAQQLQMVARTIAARSTLGMRRQVFFVNLGGFDMHDGQLAKHALLMARLNHALVYFDTAVQALGMGNNVTTFTASDFGRTFTSNGDGTDHGWGSHHFVMGGAVRGGTVVGDLPVYGTKNANSNQFDGSPDQIANGALLPGVSVDQYGAAMGRWFGASSGQLQTIFPNLANFSGSLSLMS